MVEQATQLKAGYVRSARGTGEGEMFAALEVMGPLFGRGRARGEEGGVCDRETGSYVHTSKGIRDLAADTPHVRHAALLLAQHCPEGLHHRQGAPDVDVEDALRLREIRIQQRGHVAPPRTIHQDIQSASAELGDLTRDEGVRGGDGGRGGDVEG